jgi:hypothetical protein
VGGHHSGHGGGDNGQTEGTFSQGHEDKAVFSEAAIVGYSAAIALTTGNYF